MALRTGSIQTRHRDYEERDSRIEPDATTQRLLRAATQVSCPKARQRPRDEAAALNRDLALRVAYPFHGPGMDAEDIGQVALLGSWMAVLRYGPRDGATYAIPPPSPPHR